MAGRHTDDAVMQTKQIASVLTQFGAYESRTLVPKRRMHTRGVFWHTQNEDISENKPNNKETETEKRQRFRDNAPVHIAHEKINYAKRKNLDHAFIQHWHLIRSEDKFKRASMARRLR